MSWEKLAQNRIEEALASSEFEDLPGRGLPLDPDAYFALSRCSKTPTSFRRKPSRSSRSPRWKQRTSRRPGRKKRRASLPSFRKNA